MECRNLQWWRHGFVTSFYQERPTRRTNGPDRFLSRRNETQIEILLIGDVRMSSNLNGVYLHKKHTRYPCSLPGIMGHGGTDYVHVIPGLCHGLVINKKCWVRSNWSLGMFATAVTCHIPLPSYELNEDSLWRVQSRGELTRRTKNEGWFHSLSYSSRHFPCSTSEKSIIRLHQKLGRLVQPSGHTTSAG